MNEIYRVNERLSLIKRKEEDIEEIKRQLSMCTDDASKKELNNNLNFEKNYVRSLAEEVVHIILNDMNNQVDTRISDLWEDSDSRTEIFEQLHDYFFEKKRGRTVDVWADIFDFYERFLACEIHVMFDLRASFDLTEKMKPEKREKIDNLFKYLEEAQENISNYTYEGTRKLEDRIRVCRDYFKYFNIQLLELNAHLLYEEKEYTDALDLYERLAKEHSKTDKGWHLYTSWIKGNIYCAIKAYKLALEEYDLALKEYVALKPYDLAASVVDGSGFKDQKKEVNERRSQIAAILF